MVGLDLLAEDEERVTPFLFSLLVTTAAYIHNIEQQDE